MSFTFRSYASKYADLRIVPLERVAYKDVITPFLLTSRR